MNLEAIQNQGTSSIEILSRVQARRIQSSDNNRVDEFDDIIELLNEYRCDDSNETRFVTLWMADACMGENHLWQDMDLVNRNALSALIQKHFPQLFAKNTQNMKWKKFFYKQLCERADIMICKSPTCGACVDYALCFETDDGNS
jgi:nitrogen fixation protein NifQ